MGISILFRQVGKINPFREALHNIIKIPGDELLLCSGFVAEGPGFSLVDISNLNSHLDIAVKDGLKKMVIRAGKFSKNSSSYLNTYRTRYFEFVKKLREHYEPKIKVRAYIHENWHAKIAMKANNGIPIAAIIGSSNLTSTAYGQRDNFNKECDVLIWANDKVIDKLLKDQASYNIESEYDYIQVETFKGPNEKLRLSKLYQLVKNGEGAEEQGDQI